MPELIRLQTPDFEFSVWANDISQRAKVYQTTLAKRAGLAVNVIGNATSNTMDHAHILPNYPLRFAPAAAFNTITTPQALAAQGLDEKQAELTLTSPLFFENTQYQFEWVFLGDVSEARLTHRSQRVNEAFRFVPETQTARGVIPARLTGTMNTGNDVGWLRLPLTFTQNGQTHTQQIAFEVLPTKMVLHQDLPAMYQTIDATYPLWRFSLVEKTEQDAAISQQRGHFPLMWLTHFSRLRERFEQGLKVICAAPHSRLQPTVTHTKAAKLKGRLSHKLTAQVKQDVANGRHDKHYRVEKKQLSVDTPENRFIKMVVAHSKRQLAEFETKLRHSNQAPDKQRLSDAFLAEIHQWQQPLQKVLSQSFFTDVGTYTGLQRESLVLQQKTGYSTVYRVWQELKFYLDRFGDQSSISMKSVAEIYEVWCFLCLKQILEHDLGFTLVENRQAKLAQNDFFEYQMKDGFAGAFRFKRTDGVTARLAHEPKFTDKGNPIRSFLVSQEPDIVLEVTLPCSANSAEKRTFIWLFDAKYRLKTEPSRFDTDHADIETTDYVPDDAINQMHRYRDALIHLSPSSDDEISAQKSRPVFGAFALYPGFFDQTTQENPYQPAIQEIGIGAFALLPSQGEQSGAGHRWLLDFLRSQIGELPQTLAEPEVNSEEKYPTATIAEKLYVQEAARIPYHGMRQVLYPDLTMTISLGGQRGRDRDYFEKFKQGMAQWFHMPQATFEEKFKQQPIVAEEIRYLALAVTSEHQSTTKQIDRLWPVKQVRKVKRNEMTKAQAGKVSDSCKIYYLFELGKPLTLQTPVHNVPHTPIVNSMKLTTLSHLENVTRFSELQSVYMKPSVTV